MITFEQNVTGKTNITTIIKNKLYERIANTNHQAKDCVEIRIERYILTMPQITHKSDINLMDAGGNGNLNGAVQGGARRVVDAEGKEGGRREWQNIDLNQ